MSLKYLSNFWRLPEMALINCKIELKLQWTKHCVLAATVLNNADTNSNNIIFDIKDTNYVSLLSHYQQRQSKTVETS